MQGETWTLEYWNDWKEGHWIEFHVRELPGENLKSSWLEEEER